MVENCDDRLLKHLCLRTYVVAEQRAYRGMVSEEPVVEGDGETDVVVGRQPQALL
jgi:hypothetical protein